MYTSHNHPIPNTIWTPYPLNGVTAECGGIGMCKKCSKEAARVKSMFPPEPTDPDEPQLMLW